MDTKSIPRPITIWTLLLALLGLTILGSSEPAPCEETVDVAIVGAGPGGAHSAYQLRHRGKTIALFEATDRVGGRLFTASLPEVPDLNLELGGISFVVGVHRRFEKLVEELGLESGPAYNSATGHVSHYVRGQRVMDQDMRNGTVPFDLSPEEKKNQHRIQRYYIEKLTGRTIPDEGFTREDLMTLTDTKGKLVYELTIDEALDQVATSEGKEFVKVLHFIETDMQAGVTAVRFLDYYATGAFNEKRIVKTLTNGMSALPKGLVRKFLEARDSHTLRLSTRLNSVSEEDEEGLLHLMFTEQTDGENKQMTVCAKQVILALSLSALRRIDWEPLRSERMRRVLDARVSQPASKVFMTFDTPWWLTYSNCTDYFISSDLTFKNMMDWRVSKQTGVHALSASFNDGHKALFLEELNDLDTLVLGLTKEECGNDSCSINNEDDGQEKKQKSEHRVSSLVQNLILRELAKAIEIPLKDVPEPLSTMSQFWTSNHISGGGWIYTKAGYNMEDIVEITRHPDPNSKVYVVGSDHSWGLYCYWSEGALETSQYVVDTYFGQ